MEMQKSLDADGDAGQAEEATASKRPKSVAARLSGVLQENSIPAVRKMARSPSSPLRLFWAAVFLSTFTGFVIHLASITIRFNEIPVSTETRVEKADSMPAIMICPQNYLNDVRMRPMKNRPLPQLDDMYFDDIYNDILPMFWNLIYKQRGASIDRKMVGLKIKNNFLWYLNYLWRADVQHQKEDVFLYMYMQNHSVTLRNITNSFDSSRNRCFAWEPGNGTTGSLITILNVPDGRYFYAELDAFELISDSGLWLHICFNGAFGCHDSIRYFLETGKYVKIDLRKSIVSQLPVSSQGECISEDKLFLIKDDIFVGSSGASAVPYTSSLCADVRLQRRIFAQCGCLSVLLPTERSLYDRAAAVGSGRRLFCNLPPDHVLVHSGFPAACLKGDPNDDASCFVQPRGKPGGDPLPFRRLLDDEETRDFLLRDECHDKVFHEVHRSSSDCPKLCRRQQYSSVHSIVPWPQSQLSRNFPDTFARIFVNTIKPYITKALQQLDNSSLDASVLRTVNKTFQDKVYIDFNKSSSYNKGMDFLMQRLLLLEIGYASTDMQVMSEGEAYPLKSFLSDIGGLMGLWIGMAIVSICELVLIVSRVAFFLAARCLRCLVRGA